MHDPLGTLVTVDSARVKQNGASGARFCPRTVLPPVPPVEAHLDSFTSCLMLAQVRFSVGPRQSRKASRGPSSGLLGRRVDAPSTVPTWPSHPGTELYPNHRDLRATNRVIPSVDMRNSSHTSRITRVAPQQSATALGAPWAKTSQIGINCRLL